MDDLVIQRSDHSEPGLLLLFHGVGSSPEDLLPLSRQLAERHPHAWVVSVRSPEPSDLGTGWQWFSVRDITEDNRAARIAHALPRFAACIAQWQQTSGASAARTTLVGFSQGAIMALAATRLALPPAGRVAAIAGRFAAPPTVAPAGTVIHLLHGEQDGVVSAHASVQAHAQLKALGAAVTLDLVPGLGHGIDHRMLERLQERLATPADGVGAT